MKWIWGEGAQGGIASRKRERGNAEDCRDRERENAEDCRERGRGNVEDCRERERGNVEDCMGRKELVFASSTAAMTVSPTLSSQEGGEAAQGGGASRKKERGNAEDCMGSKAGVCFQHCSHV